MTMTKEAYRTFLTGRALRCRVLVVGDVMLDKYYYGDVSRISPEAPVPIAHITAQKETLGGAANVAHNLARLGAQTSIAGYVGDDYHRESLEGKLAERRIDSRALIRAERPTTTKLRVIGGHQQMIRLDFEETQPPAAEDARRLADAVRAALRESVDALVLSDYGKGVCTESFCQQVIREAHAHGVPVLVDPKGTAWGKYAGADYITPNLKEINAVLPEPIANEDAAVERAAHYVRGKFDLKSIVVTRSEAGLSLVEEAQTLHIPTRAQEVYDVSGAGDTVISVLALGLAGGLPARDAVRLANLAAGVVVAKLGTYAIASEELCEALREERE